MVAATACPEPFVLRNDVTWNGVPAGRADRNPGTVSPTLVTLIAIAEASAGTPSGSGTVSSPPGGSTPANGPDLARVDQAAGGDRHEASRPRDWVGGDERSRDVDDQIARHVLVELDRAARAELDDRRVGDGAVASRVEHGGERPSGAARIERDEPGVGGLRRRDGHRHGHRSVGHTGPAGDRRLDRCRVEADAPAVGAAGIGKSVRSHRHVRRRRRRGRGGVRDGGGGHQRGSGDREQGQHHPDADPGPARTCCPTLPLMSASSSSDGSPEPQVCVVTGANSGIGRATAVHLAESGYTVCGTVRSRLQGRQVERSRRRGGRDGRVGRARHRRRRVGPRRLRRDPRSRRAESTISSTTPVWAVTASSRRRHRRGCSRCSTSTCAAACAASARSCPGCASGAGHDRQHHVGRRSHRRRRPGALRGVEVGVRGAE